jgi:hypothetical protein
MLELRWEAGPLPGLVLAYRADGRQVGRVRRQAGTPNAWEGHYDVEGFDRRPPAGLSGARPDDARCRVISGVSRHEAKAALERHHARVVAAAEAAGDG